MARVLYGSILLLLLVGLDLVLSTSAPDNNCSVVRDFGCNCIWQESLSYSIECSGKNLLSSSIDLSDAVHLTVNNNDIPVLEEIRMTSLLTLYLQENKIQFIMPNSFQKLARLDTLNIMNNLISRLGNDTFVGLRMLKSLYLSGNPLFYISSETFTGNNLPQLEFLWISGCKIITVEDGSFSGLAKLQSLDLSKNWIESLGKFGNSAQPLVNLTDILLSHNRISLVDGNVFENLPRLALLDLNHNVITEVTSTSFSSLKKSLTHLYLTSNLISSVGTDSFHPLERLVRLDLRDNRLTVLHGLEPPWETLTEIHVTGNPWDCDGCTNSWLQQEGSAKDYNTGKNVSCSSPDQLKGKQIYDNNVFAHCDPTEVAENTRHPALMAVLGCLISLFALGLSIVLLLRCRSERRKQKHKPLAKTDPEPSMAYQKMKDLSPKYTISDDDDDDI